MWPNYLCYKEGGQLSFSVILFLWLFLTVTSSFLNKYCYILFSLFLHLTQFCLSFETQIKGNLACDTRTPLSPFSISTILEHFPCFSTALPPWSNSREVSFRTHTIQLVHSLPSFNCLQFPRYLKQSQRADVLVFFPSTYQLLPYLWATPVLKWTSHLNKTPGVQATKQPSIPIHIPYKQTHFLKYLILSHRFQSGLIVTPILQVLGQESPRLLFRSRDCFQVSSISDGYLPLSCGQVPLQPLQVPAWSILNTSLPLP